VLNAQRKSSGAAALDCGIAIHIGDVMYGNVGAADRLDFTVIGPAVNLVCRMETLCEPLESTILVSGDFARLSSRGFVSRGHHVMKGIATPHEVFALESGSV
jgi:adenylate cyclase